MSQLEIKCPQPTRPLKRKLSALDPGSSADGEYTIKKSRFCSPPPATDAKWLTHISPIEERQSSRSDSYLFRGMSNGSQHRAFGNRRPGSTGQGGNNSQTYLPLSPQSLQGPPTSYALTQGHLSYAPSAVLSNVSSPQPTPPSRTQTASSKEDTKYSKRILSPAYRDELANHSVYIDSWAMTMPAEVREFTQNILTKERTSPDLTQQELASIRRELSTLDNADEEVIRTAFAGTAIFPKHSDYTDELNNTSLATGANLPLDREGIPHNSSVRYPPIVTPKPDMLYGYSHGSFDGSDSQLAEVMLHRRLQAYAKPNSATYWPFFAVEYKSPSRLGSRWVAENQNAGTGAHCVNSIETLLSYTKPKENRQITDSIAFSCVMDLENASLWVHWVDHRARQRFVSSEAVHYHFRTPDDINAFRSNVKNIIDFGLNERLNMIKRTLYKIVPQMPLWDEEDKAARVRLSSQLDTATPEPGSLPSYVENAAPSQEFYGPGAGSEVNADQDSQR